MAPVLEASWLRTFSQVVNRIRSAVKYLHENLNEGLSFGPVLELDGEAHFGAKGTLAPQYADSRRPSAIYTARDESK